MLEFMVLVYFMSFGAKIRKFILKYENSFSKNFEEKYVYFNFVTFFCQKYMSFNFDCAENMRI